jgi:CheY-like chemotaxis protein
MQMRTRFAAARTAPDALIVDYRLAAMTGLQVIDQLRARRMEGSWSAVAVPLQDHA